MSYSELLEDVIQNTGGCGTYQYLSTVIFHWEKIVAVWNYHFMTFNGQVPEIHCSPINGTGVQTRDLEKWCQKLCDNITYDEGMVNIVSEWNLVCGQEWIPTIIFTILLVGATTGAFISGPIADRIGRKPVVFFSALCIVVFNLMSALSVSWQMYAVLQFFTGVALEGYINVGTILMVEYAPRSWRAWIVLLPSWSVAASLFALVAWSLHDWRKMHLLCALVALPFLLTVWFSSYVMFFGFSFGVQNISGDVYMNMFLLNVVDIPVTLISPFIINKFGRKRISSLAYITSGALAFAIGIFKCYESGVHEEVIRIVAFVAKAFVAMCTQILTVYTLELYPTVVRSTALGCHIAASDIATVIVPLLIRMDRNTPGLLYFLSGILMLLSSAIIVSFLRETKDLALQEMVGEADKTQTKLTDNNYRSIE